ncbi:hypothetical protein [Pseudarthrobacter chlorophenolicus]|uniref:hypothetical protein n=1 Tax=Pseudarthrobacter chlorophenolicus TaxID=85085 RepID=UPI0002DE1EB0|nr:hypothetical protein [Pseudarthrobacter chlorophenolicus]
MSSNTDQPLGYVTIRIPIHAVTESESWEIPQEYTYLEPGEAELVTHDMPSGWHESLREELIESGIRLAQWTPEELASTCTRPAEAAPSQAPSLQLFSFEKEAR